MVMADGCDHHNNVCSIKTDIIQINGIGVNFGTFESLFDVSAAPNSSSLPLSLSFSLYLSKTLTYVDEQTEIHIGIYMKSNRWTMIYLFSGKTKNE